MAIAAYQRIAVAIAANGSGWPWKLLRLDVRENCRGNCREVPWFSMVGTTEFATDRIAARAVATTVAFAVEVP